MPAASNDARLMARALRLAEKGQYTTHPNPQVGCVIAHGDEIVGEGFHLRAGEGHAEANALRQAGDRAHAATVYVTLEPCSFAGRTPACASALIAAGVSRVVVATLDPDPRNAGTGINMLRDAGISVDIGMMQSAAQDLIRGHVSRFEYARPFVRLKLAMSMDGKTALSNGESQWITSAESRRDVQRWRARSAAIVTGVQTVIDDDPLLSVRAAELASEHAELAASIHRPVYVLDSKGRFPEAAKLAQSQNTVIVSTHSALKAANSQTLALGPGPGGVDLVALLAELAAREHSEVLFECGRTLAGSLIHQGLVDELILYMAPKLMGGSALSLLQLPEIDRMADLFTLELRDVRQIGPDLRVIAGLKARDA